MATAFLDLDRTLLRGASGPALSAALAAEGLSSPGGSLPGQSLLYGLFNRFGENALSMALARAAALATKGWSKASAEAAGRRAVPELLELVAPYAPARLASLRAEGHDLVLATTSPYDFVAPLAEALGLDDVIATRYDVDENGNYTGKIDGGFIWGLGKVAAVKRWATERDVPLEDCHAFSDSVFDVPLLSSVGHPHPVNPDVRLLAVAKLQGWVVEQWERPDGVASLFGLEAYDVLRHFVRPELFPYARFAIEGLDHIPSHGPVILAANHRSYFDVAALALVAARLGRPVRAMAKAELFDAPVISTVARSLGGIRVDRAGDPSEAYREAEAALKAGEVLIILPQGTIPRGEEFFSPDLRAKSGVARLAQATGAPVVPIGLWGTDDVWPRSSSLPTMTTLVHPVRVTVAVGSPLSDLDGDPEVVTQAIMDAIAALLPEASRMVAEPTAEQLARTYPSGADDEAVS